MNTLRDTINEIIYHIKHDNAYDQAALLFKQNQLTMQQLGSMTFKLNSLEFARLADSIKRSK